jgi:hypothetical protein
MCFGHGYQLCVVLLYFGKDLGKHGAKLRIRTVSGEICAVQNDKRNSLMYEPVAAWLKLAISSCNSDKQPSDIRYLVAFFAYPQQPDSSNFRL